jgi:protoporphyrinogen oxidase
MNIAIIGGGFTGLTAALDLLNQGHNVAVFEAAPQVGGLASGFKAPGWDWSLERFYHHIFTTDKAIIALAKQIGVGDMLFFNEQITAFHCAEHGAHPVTPVDLLRYPHLPFVDRVRYGISGAQLKLRSDWQRLERTTAERHLTNWAGKRAYQQLWQPLFEGKFGSHASEINAAWIWARVKSRSFKLGYVRGGFQAFADALAQAVKRRGGTVHTNCPVEQITQNDTQWNVHADGAAQTFDKVIVASGPGVLAKLVPDLPHTYLQNVHALRSMGAVVMVAALNQQLLTNGVYWLNLSKNQFPFLALVEHTNMLDSKHYNGDRLIYCGDYLPTDHRYFNMREDEITKEWLAALPTANPAFKPEWVKQTWLFRERYAQPIVPLNHSRNVPSLQTPLPGLLWASLHHVYPWDRGTNFAVELGHRVAREAMTG